MDWDLATDHDEGGDSDEDTSIRGGGPPEFGDDMTQHQFRSACVDYAEWASENMDALEAVDLSDVTFEVSTKMKRAAGKVVKRNPSGNLVLRVAVGAYDEWGWGDDIIETIEHELIHVWEHQVHGKAGHGAIFKRKADELDAPRHCPQFTDYTFGLFCTDCGDMIGGKYRRCKTVNQPEKYRSPCCKAELRSEEL